MTLTSTPLIVQGFRRSYRLYTVEHCDFDHFPQYRDGGPSMIAYDGWCTSTSSLDRVFSSASVVAADTGLHTVSVFKVISQVPYEIKKHPIDGTAYPSDIAARRAKFNAGVVAFMVYEPE